MVNVAELLKSNGIELVFLSMEKDGYYLEELKMMVVNSNLSEEKQKAVVLHEMKHALDHRELSMMYDKHTYRSKMENEANSFMIDYMIKENDGLYDYTTVLEEYNLGLGWEPWQPRMQ